jgi:trehalose-phosphatase
VTAPPAAPADLPHALERWDEIACHLAGRRPVLFLDYDGTLAPIARRPEQARLPGATRGLLRRLTTVLPMAVVSGRARADVEKMVGLDGIAYAGSHGFDLAAPDGRPLAPPASAGIGDHLRELIASTAAELKERLARFSAGVRVEPKTYAVAVHYRLAAPADVPAVEAAVDAAVDAHPELRKTGGKKVFELRPAVDWDKGRALLFLLAELGLNSAGHLPLYLGDDETDEDAFRAVAGHGIGVLVAAEPRPTAASFYLRDPEEVRVFLARLLALAEGRDDGEAPPVGVGPHPRPWPDDPRLDPELLAAGDRRNVVDHYRYWQVEAIVADLARRRHPFHVAVENWTHDLNIGSVVRNANAFLARAVHIVGRRRWNRRGAMMTEIYQTVVHHPTLAEFAAWAAREELPVLGVDNLPGAEPIDRVAIPRACVLLFGGEGPGLSAGARRLAERVLSIPQYGSTRSINAGAASAVAMVEWCRRWADDGDGSRT